jgi:general stress protein 26
MPPNLRSLLESNVLGVISTAQENGTESAVVHFEADESCAIYLNTRTSSRKYANILKNPNVSFVVYGRDPAMTLQLEGTASIIEDISAIKDEYSKLLKRTLAAGTVPPIMKTSSSEMALIKITPTWARFSDFSENGLSAAAQITQLVG